MTKPHTIGRVLDHALKRLRLSLWARHLFTALVFILLVNSVLFPFISAPTLWVMDGLLMLAWVLVFPLRPDVKRLTRANMVQHLNRIDPALEESAMLVLQDPDQLPLLQQLQYQKVAARVLHTLSDPTAWWPRQSIKPLLVLGLVAVTLFLASPYLWSLAQQKTHETAALSEPAPYSNSLLSAAVRLTAPAYMGREVESTDSLDIEIYSGTRTDWTLDFAVKDGRYFLDMGDENLTELIKQSDNRYQASAVLSKTGLYSVVHRLRGSDHRLPEIYTITVQPDMAPTVRILEPNTTTVEIAKSGSTTFISQALIKDDFGISDVSIRASVAKGSGEGVKFRDENFVHDSVQPHMDGGSLYTKDWELKALGMEPGDELYFTVIVTDNKLPAANVSKSNTLIIRWLDDEEPAIAAAGIVVDVEPEYFKSQRQIIIDTEALIVDQDSLSKTQFQESSYGLGRDQNYLKQKYGQYLGDEFGEGPGAQMEAMGVEIPAGPEDDDHGGDDHGDDDHENDDHGDNENGEDHSSARPEIGHAHNETVGNSDKSGKAALIAKFGHSHEESDIGPIAKRDPKTLMKKAVSIMWQAELHLMLAEPKKSLPYQYEAMKFLKLAKQADRIYVKRLGFEPPPVSEKKRLTGELEDIKSREEKLENPVLDTDAGLVIRRFFALVDRTLFAKSALSDQDLAILRAVSSLLQEEATRRPALIKQAASVERMIRLGSLTLADCSDCLTSVKATLYALLPDGVAPAGLPPVYYPVADPLISSKEGVE